MLPRLPETLLSSCNDGLQEGDKLGIALRLPDEVVDVRRDHITVPVHDARRKRAQLGKPSSGGTCPHMRMTLSGLSAAMPLKKHPGVDRLFRFAVPIGVTVQRPERMAPLGERHIPEQPAQEVAVRGVGVAPPRSRLRDG